MQAAIDRVFRSFSLKPPAWLVDETPAEVSRDDAEALAMRLLDNYKAQVAHRGRQH